MRMTRMFEAWCPPQVWRGWKCDWFECFGGIPSWIFSLKVIFEEMFKVSSVWRHSWQGGSWYSSVASEPRRWSALGAFAVCQSDGQGGQWARWPLTNRYCFGIIFLFVFSWTWFQFWKNADYLWVVVFSFWDIIGSWFWCSPQEAASKSDSWTGWPMMPFECNMISGVKLMNLTHLIGQSARCSRRSARSGARCLGSAKWASMLGAWPFNVRFGGAGVEIS